MSAIRRDRVSGHAGSFGELFHGRKDTLLAGAYTMAAQGEATWQNMDNGGAARNVRLPDEASNAGKMLMITNYSTGAFALTLQSSAGVALAPATTVAQNKGVLVYCDGTSWKPVLVSA